MSLPLLTTAFIAVYILTPVILLALLRYFRVRISEFSVLTFILLFFMIFSYIGTAFLFFGLDPFRVTLTPDPAVTFTVLVYSSIAMIGLLIGFSLAFRLIPLHLSTSPVPPLSLGSFLSAWFLLILCIGIFLFYLHHVHGLAIFSLISGNISEYQIQRSAMTNSFSGKYYRYDVFLRQIPTLLAFILFSNALRARTYMSSLAFVASIAILFLSDIMAGEKAPIAMSIIGLYVIYTITQNRHSYRFVPLLLSFLSIFAIEVLMYKFLNPDVQVSMPIQSTGDIGAGTAVATKGLLRLAQLMMSRTFTGQLEAAYHYVDFFPHYHGFLWGLSLPNPHGLFGFTHYNIPREIMNWVHPELGAQGVVGSMPTAFWGEAYANFGLAGVIVVPPIMGLWVGGISAGVRALPPSPITAGFLAWLALHFSTLALSGFSGFLLDVDLIAAAVAVLIVWGGGQLWQLFEGRSASTRQKAE